MTERIRPQRVANDISVVLRTVLGADRFPVNVKEVALEISSKRFPDDPIVAIKGDVLPGFEGCLVPAPSGRKGWGILYNTAHTSGRVNFTLGHEFGHYLLHRLEYPDGFQCTTEDMASWESEYAQLEHQANEFAAALLMPFDDFRRQIDAARQPDLDELGSCADRYDVSLIAAILRWLQYTSQRSMLVISREGFVLWARSSKSALRSGLYYRTRNRPAIEIPAKSLATQRPADGSSRNDGDHGAEVWLREPCREQVLFSDQYDFTISLLHFSGASWSFTDDDGEEEDLFDKMARRSFTGK